VKESRWGMAFALKDKNAMNCLDVGPAVHISSFLSFEGASRQWSRSGNATAERPNSTVTFFQSRINA